MGRFRFNGLKAQGAICIKDYASLLSGELITIGNKVYEFRTSGSASGSHIQVNVGASNALTITALITAINANKPTNAAGVASAPATAVVDPVDTSVCRIYADSRGAAGNMIFTTTMADSDNVITGSGLLEYGENAGEQTLHRGSYVVSAIDVLALSIVIETGLTTPRDATVETYGSTGAKKTSTALKTVSGTKILLDFTGATDHVAGDVIVWSAWE